MIARLVTLIATVAFCGGCAFRYSATERAALKNQEALTTPLGDLLLKTWENMPAEDEREVDALTRLEPL